RLKPAVHRRAAGAGRRPNWRRRPRLRLSASWFQSGTHPGCRRGDRAGPRAALMRASSYAKGRVVVGRPIGQNQAIQHPLAECWMELEAADLMTFKAAWQYDHGIACGPAANAAKYLAAEAGFKACQTAIATHGGYGYARNTMSNGTCG